MDTTAFLQHMNAMFGKQEPFLPGQGHPEIRALRHLAIKQAQQLDVPSVRNERWKHARFDTLINTYFAPYLHPVEKHQLSRIAHFIQANEETINIVFLNGHFVPMFSHNNHIAIRLQSLSRLAKTQPELSLDFLASQHHNDFFTHLNTAFCSDGAVVIIPENLQVKQLVMIYHFLVNPTEQEMMIHPQSYIHLGKNSHVVVVENIISQSASRYNLINSNTIVSCEQGATCDLMRITQHAKTSLGFHHLNAVLLANSTLNVSDIAWGAHYERHTQQISLKEPAAELNCYGLMLPNTHEHSDWVSTINHYAPHGNSLQRVKSVIAEEGHSSFLGNIAVNQAAQQTNTIMVNENLLLGEKGQADSAPQLEILADDVKCNHAATVTQLDEKSLFYLHSRGFSLDAAKQLLLHAFTKDIVQHIRHPIVLEQCQISVAQRVDQLLRGTL